MCGKLVICLVIYKIIRKLEPVLVRVTADDKDSAVEISATWVHTGSWPQRQTQAHEQKHNGGPRRGGAQGGRPHRQEQAPPQGQVGGQWGGEETLSAKYETPHCNSTWCTHAGWITRTTRRSRRRRSGKNATQVGTLTPPRPACSRDQMSRLAYPRLATSCRHGQAVARAAQEGWWRRGELGDSYRSVGAGGSAVADR